MATVPNIRHDLKQAIKMLNKINNILNKEKVIDYNYLCLETDVKVLDELTDLLFHFNTYYHYNTPDIPTGEVL